MARLTSPEAAEAWRERLTRLEQAQGQFAAEGDGLIDTVRSYLAQQSGTIGPIKTGELFQKLRPLALNDGWAFPKTASGFGLALSVKRRVIELELNATYVERRVHSREREVTITLNTLRPSTGRRQALR